MKRNLLTLLLCFAWASSNAQFSLTINSRDAFCGLNSGYASANHSSFSGHLYTYQWNTGDTTRFIQNLAPGTYTVTVSNQFNESQEASVTIGMTVDQPVHGDPMVDCAPGACEARVYLLPATAGTAEPITYAVSPPQCVPMEPYVDAIWYENGHVIGGLEAGVTYTITATDANGCSGTYTTTIDTLGPDYTGAWPIVPHVADQIVPACGGAANGSFRVVPGGGMWRLDGPDGEELIFFNGPPYVFTGLVAGTYTAHRNYSSDSWGSSLAYYTGYCEAIEVVIPALPEPCTGVTGQVTHDTDEDCSIGIQDYQLPYRVLAIEPGPHFAFTGGDGTYWKNLAYGTYTIEQPSANEDHVCAPSPIPFTIDATSPLAQVDLFKLSTLPHDVSVWIHSWPAQVGFPTGVNIVLTNNSAFPSGELSLAFNYDPDLLDPAFSAPLAIASIPPFGQVFIQFTANVPPNVELLDEVLNYSATVSNTVSEVDTDNNSMALEVVIVGAYDPNDKQGRTSSRTSADQYFLDLDDHIDYTVRFQNTGTAAAQTVVIRDVLDTDLDITSLQILGASHDFVPSFGEGRELVFTFNDIGLPDSTADLLGSQGYISYRIKPEEGIMIGDLIENTAGIYFDFNPPIITNTTSHAVDLSTAIIETPRTTLHVAPNPARDMLRVTVEGNSTAVQVFGMDGRQVNAPVTKRSNGWDMDVSDLDPGTYIVRTEFGSARFVKQ